jgi:predicted PurR-regulated permease PerM
MTTPPPSGDLARTTLAVLFIAGMIAASFWILRPFLAIAIWATTIVVATWPLMLRVQAGLWGRRGLAVAVMTLLLLLVLIVPLSLAIATIATRTDEIAGWAQALTTLRVPPPPDWVEGLPVIGSRLAAKWRESLAARPEELPAGLASYAGKIVSWTVGWIVSTVGGVGMALLQFLLVVLLSAIMYANGETAADGVLRFARRLAGPRGEVSARLAAQAIRGVALGVVVTALVQAALAGVGLAVAGVPFAAILTALTVMLCIAQLGPVLVLLPAALWLYWTGSTSWAIALLVWTVVVGSIDNVLRPILIRRGADLPLLLILVGVVGGILGFGIIGIFVGPVVVAVTYTLLVDWVRSGETETPPAASPADSPR